MVPVPVAYLCLWPVALACSADIYISTDVQCRGGESYRDRTELELVCPCLWPVLWHVALVIRVAMVSAGLLLGDEARSGEIVQLGAQGFVWLGREMRAKDRVRVWS